MKTKVKKKKQSPTELKQSMILSGQWDSLNEYVKEIIDLKIENEEFN